MEETDKAKLRRELRRLHKKKGVRQHSVNFNLLMIILVLIAAMITATFYFYIKYDELDDRGEQIVEVNEEMEDSYRRCQQDLRSSLDMLENLNSQLNTSSASRSSLNELYIDLENTKSRLESNLSNAKDSLSTCRLELQEYADELEDAMDTVNDYIEQYNLKAQELVTAQGIINSLEDQIEDYTRINNRLSDDLDDLQSCVDREENCSACR